MGLLKAAIGAIGGSLSDQWKDFLTVPKGIEPTAALFPQYVSEQMLGAARIPKHRLQS